MFPSLFTGTTVPLLQQVARFTERRQDVLAGNVANISTPDYKTRDLPVEGFQKALQEAVSGRLDVTNVSSPGWEFQPKSASDQNPEAAFGEELFQATDAPPKGITFHDGNNRSIEHQMMEMTKNSLLYSSAIELMKIQLNRLQAIVSERP